ncbi:hypothetical protein N9349_04320 [Candidatus Pelagibacter sp.]|nr:hypothetical protein [Candidatus Pelagibacter sp.]
MAGGGYASGKHAYAISDRSGLRFPYSEMVREWNGSLVHYSEFEAKQPQLQPKPVGSDPQALYNPRPQPASKTSLILLDNNPFTSIISGGTTYVNVYSQDHQRAAGSIVRFRGPPVVTSAGPGGADEADLKNLQSFANIPTFDNVSDLNNANGFTIALGQIDSAGNVTGATTSDPLTSPINYFYITSTSNATTGNVKGGGDNCSAGPVTLKVVNG